MKRNEILLSSGSVLWLGVKDAIFYTENIGYDGIELLPTKKVIKETTELLASFQEKTALERSFLRKIKSLHQNWRLDSNKDKTYGIPLLTSFVYEVIRKIFFPDTQVSKRFLGNLSSVLHVPVTVHDIESLWTKDHKNREFTGGIAYEVFDTKRAKKTVKTWLTNKSHKIILDTRDDQSIVWARNHGFHNWKIFWRWIGTSHIQGLQLTFIGFGQMHKILHHNHTLAEEQLLWLNKQKWTGTVVIEVNPLMLFLLFKGDLKRGFTLIGQFVRTTLHKGKMWS